MRQIYFYFVYDYSPLIACVCSLAFFLFLLKKPKQGLIKKLSFIPLIVACLVSVEFYLYQIGTFPVNIIIPIGTVLVFFLNSKGNKYPKFISFMIVIFSLYLIFGLGLLSSSSNTWGEGPATAGIFVVSNSLVMLIALFAIQQKYFNVFVICKFLIALVGFAFIYFDTSGFNHGDYDGASVIMRRGFSVLICLFSLVEGFLILRYRKIKNTDWGNLL